MLTHVKAVFKFPLLDKVTEFTADKSLDSGPLKPSRANLVHFATASGRNGAEKLLAISVAHGKNAKKKEVVLNTTARRRRSRFPPTRSCTRRSCRPLAGSRVARGSFCASPPRAPCRSCY